MPSSPRVLVQLLKIVGMVVSLCVAMQAPAQTLDAPLKLIVPTAPGGAIDRATRILADSLKDRLGVAVIVENQGAAGGLIAAQRVKTAQAGENVLLVGNPTTNVLAPILFKNAGYDPQLDFVALSCIRTYSYAVAVGPATPVRDMKELVAWLKAHPTQANFGVPALGSLAHLFALMLADVSKVTPQMIGYRGSAPLQAELMAGHVPVAVDVFDALLNLHKASKLRILAVSAAGRSPELPDVPTMKEAGINIEGDGWTAIFAPASMPADKVGMLARAIVAAMGSSDVQSRFRAGNLEWVVSTPEQTAQMLAAYRAKWEPFARASGVQE